MSLLFNHWKNKIEVEDTEQNLPVQAKTRKPKLINGSLKSTQLFEHYKTVALPELQVTEEQYKRILKKFAVKFMDKVLLDSEEVQLPIVGGIRIKKFKQEIDLTKPNKLRVDWAATKKHKKRIYHLNDHRDGFIYRYFWRRPKIANRQYFSFMAERYHCKRRLAKILKTTDTEYFS